MNISKNAELAEWPLNVKIRDLQQKFGSPAWILSEPALLGNIAAFTEFTGKASGILFPVKSNPSLAVLRIMAAEGLGADCASQTEIDLALFAGIRLSDISYNTPAQDLQLCKVLLENGAMVVMDDPQALKELSEVIDLTQLTGRLFIRVNLPAFIDYAKKNENQDLMAHSHQSSKFGIPSEELFDTLCNLKIPVSGLHVHVGTQMDNMASFQFAMDQLHLLADTLNAAGHNIRLLNIGGGLGIPFGKKDEFPSLKRWTEVLSPMKKGLFEYFIEPGHALVGNTVALLSSVLAIKNSRGKRWAICDVGTDQLAKVTLLKWQHRVIQENGAEFEIGHDAIAGPLCFAGDTLLNDIHIGDLKVGDPLMLTEAGAYTFSLSNHFNGRLQPRWVVINRDGEARQVNEKESRYDGFHISNYCWGSSGNAGFQLRELNKSRILALSSVYLRDKSREDRFYYESVKNIGRGEYEFLVKTDSEVDFISMPFAIRIFGDATIVAVLDMEGFSEKRISVWGRKLSLDCLRQVPSGQMLNFNISLSEASALSSAITRIARFRSRCGNCAGSFVLNYHLPPRQD